MEYNRRADDPRVEKLVSDVAVVDVRVSNLEDDVKDIRVTFVPHTRYALIEKFVVAILMLVIAGVVSVAGWAITQTLKAAA